MLERRHGSLALTAIAIFTSAGCAPTDEAGDLAMIAESIVSDGLTCQNQHLFFERDPDEAAMIVSLVRDRLLEEELDALLDAEERCESPPASADGVSDAALYSGSWAGEPIERTYSSGGISGSVGRDGSGLGWMCNGGAAEFPADYVISIPYLPGAYANRSRLRVRANTSSASWALSSFGNALASRVYPDDSLRVCVGYARMTFYGAGYLFPSDFSFLVSTSSW